MSGHALTPFQVKALRRNVKLFRGGLVFKAHGLVNHSTLCSNVIKRRRRKSGNPFNVFPSALLAYTLSFAGRAGLGAGVRGRGYLG